MQVETVTAPDAGFLNAVRATLAASDDSVLCVAFVQERGVRLLAKEFDDAWRRGAKTRLLVTTAFDRGGATGNALAVARDFGVDVRVHNHAHGTYHPKLYLGACGDRAQAVIGSANLTFGLAGNVEVGVALSGLRSDDALARAWQIGESLWAHARSEPWVPESEATGPEPIDPELLMALELACRQDPVFATLGRAPRPNRVVALTPAEVLVETERTHREGTGAQSIPAWMLNLAWECLRSRGELSNMTLLNQLRVHRSSAVCAMLARVPGVRVSTLGGITLFWRGPAGS